MNQTPRLLLLGCSQRKRHATKSMTALELYDGPHFRVLRRYLSLSPTPADLQIYVLSAKWGLLHFQAPLHTYDFKLNQLDSYAKACLKLAVEKQWNALVSQHDYQSLCVSAPQQYMALLQLDHLPISPIYALKGSPGQSTAALREWLWQSVGIPSHTQNSSPLVRIGDKKWSFTLGQIDQLVVDGTPLPVEARRFHSWSALIAGQKIAPKWLVSQLTGLSVARFNTEQACRALHNWGVKIEANSILDKYKIS